MAPFDTVANPIRVKTYQGALRIVMKINGRVHKWVFHTWSRIGRNYVVSLGYQPWRHAWGVELHWGCRFAMGEEVPEGETRFADGYVWSVPVFWR